MPKQCVSCEAEDCVCCQFAERELESAMELGDDPLMDEENWTDTPEEPEDDEDEYFDDPETDYPQDSDDESDESESDDD